MTEDQFAGWRSWCELEAIGTAAGLSAPLLVLALDGAVRHLRGETCVLEAMRPVGGGSIHRAFVLECSGARFFAKVNDAAQRANFRAEANGLSALQGAGVRVPTTFSEGNGPGFAYLLLEYLDVVPLDGSAARALGRALARLHAREAGTRFGWECANYIGSTVQQNGWHDDWSGFWCEERMAPQLALAHQNGFSARLQSLGERLLCMSATPRSISP